MVSVSAALSAVMLACTVTQDRTVINEEPTCTSCEISATKVLTLGDADGPGILIEHPRHVAVDHRGNYYVAAGELPLVFSSEGRFLRSIGRLGPGPGELRGNLVPIPLPGDSVLIGQPRDGRATLFSPSGEFAREYRLPLGFSNLFVITWPDSVLVVGMFADRARFGLPLHLISFAGSSPQVFKSGGAVNHGEFIARDWRGVALPSLPTASWWTVTWPYDLRQFDGNLKLMQTLVRRPSWWTEDRDFPLGLPHQKPPHPGIVAVSVDDAGLLWVFVHTPSPDWRDAWEGIPLGATEIPSSRIQHHKLFHTLVEVIDPSNRTVLARTTIADYVIGVLPGSRAVAYVASPDGTPFIEIIDLNLRR